MNVSEANQIMPKHSLQNFGQISKLKYFVHRMHNSECVEKVLKIRTERWLENKVESVQDDQQKYEEPWLWNGATS